MSSSRSKAVASRQPIPTKVQPSTRGSFFGEMPSFMARGNDAVTTHAPPNTVPGRRRSTMDEALSKAIDAMDFEYKEDIRKGKRTAVVNPDDDRDDPEVAGDQTATDFNQKEIRSNSCWRQMISMSTFICLGQIGVLAYMLHQDGMAPVLENPNYGPPAYTLVKYGARDTWAIKHRSQWYRLVSPICLHAGIIHICTNVMIQLRIGGYLNSLYGTKDWLLIYVFSGIFGSLCSCAMVPQSVGVGSSGAVLGLLASWVVWLVFRWRKVPKESRMKRNLQLIVVSLAIAGTLFFSFTPYVDWATHFGGAGMGGMIGLLVLSEELDNACTRWFVRLVSLFCIVSTYFYAVWYLVNELECEPLFPPQY